MASARLFAFPNIDNKASPQEFAFLSLDQKLYRVVTLMATLGAGDTQAVPSAEGDIVSCFKCGAPADDGIAKGHGVVRKTCNNIYQLLYRHVGGMPPALQTLDPKPSELYRKPRKMN